MGIDALKAIITFVIFTAEELVNIDSNEDGKVKFGEIIGAVSSIGFKLPAAYAQIPALKEEVKDLSPAEIQELVEHFSEEFDISNDKAEQVIESSLALLANAYGAVREIVDLVKSE